MLRNPFRQTSQHAQQRLAQCKAPMAFVCAGLIAGALLPLGGGTGAAGSASSLSVERPCEAANLEESGRFDEPADCRPQDHGR